MAEIKVINAEGQEEPIELPEGISLSLMELLKACEYPVLGTCDGMALCGSCHVEVLKGMEHLHPISDQEEETLDSLPNYRPNSRLACQIHITDEIDGLVIKILGEG